VLCKNPQCKYKRPAAGANGPLEEVLARYAICP